MNQLVLHSLHLSSLSNLKTFFSTRETCHLSHIPLAQMIFNILGRLREHFNNALFCTQSRYFKNTDENFRCKYRHIY